METNDWDNGKISVIVHLKNPANQNRIIEMFQNFSFPEAFKPNLTIAHGKTSAEAFSKIRDDSGIKIYTTDSILQINPEIWMQFAYVDNNAPNARLIGFAGSELPYNADISEATSIFGSYTFSDDGKTARRDHFQDPYVFQEVTCIDPALMILLGNDIEIDPKVADEFLGASLCSKVREKGFSAVVAMNPQDQPVAIFDQPSIYSEFKDPNYERHRKHFFERYKKIFLPLVSILIPAYNQPEFFVQALDSALDQDYPNIEIRVGDDSTDDRVEKAVKPYLRRHKNIFYEHHEKPLGFNGRGNMQKLLDDSRGEYIQFLYHDDLLLPGKISTMMQYFLSDITGEIAFVASSRKLIDPDGNIVGKNSFVPANDIILSMNALNRQILERFSNGIGELTTVLFRKKDLWHDENGRYLIGNFLGMQDDSMWDVSTFLEIGRKRKQIVYLKDFYSAMRLHASQNSQNPNVTITILLDFLGFDFAAYAYHFYIDSREKFLQMMNNWLKQQDLIRSNFHNFDWNEFLSKENTVEIKIFKNIIHALENKNYDEAISYELEYIEKKNGSDEILNLFRVIGR